MMNNKKTFEIPGTNNQLEALAKYLNVNTDIESEFKSIEVIDIKKGVHRFKHDGKTYRVCINDLASSNNEIPTINFNGNLWCIYCENTLANAKLLWDELGDVWVNEDNLIEQPFLHFEKGSDCFDIWHWFELKFGLTIATDLM